MAKKRQAAIKISKEKREEMISSLKQYFINEHEEEIGDLSASLLLDFITEELAGEFYNQGVADSYRYINERCEDLLSIQK